MLSGAPRSREGFLRWLVKRNKLLCVAHLKSVYCFLEGLSRMGRESFVAGIYRCVSSQTLSVSSAEKSMCSGLQWEEQQQNPFRFFQLESDARSCCFREAWIYKHACEIYLWMRIKKIDIEKMHSIESRSYCWLSPVKTKPVVEISLCVS